jgi:hypothetical protein
VGLPPGQHPKAILTGPGGLRRTIRTTSFSLGHPHIGRYRLTLRSVLIGRSSRRVRRGSLAKPLVSATGGYVRDGHATMIKGTYGTILNPGVQRAPPIGSVVGDPSDPTAVRLTAGAKRPSTGSILTSGPTDLLPIGLVSRVTGTKKLGATAEVSLEAVPVTEAVPELSFVGSLALRLAKGATGGSPDTAAEASVTHTRARAASSCTPPRLVKFGAHLDTVELREAFLGTWPPQVKLTLAVRTTEELGVAVAAAGINCDWSGRELGPYSAAIPVGPVVVPVYATIPLKAGVHINGTLQAGTVHIASTTVAHAAAGLGIARGANIHLEAGCGPEFDWSSGHDCELLLDRGSISAGVTVLGKSLNTRRLLLSKPIFGLAGGRLAPAEVAAERVAAVAVVVAAVAEGVAVPEGQAAQRNKCSYLRTAPRPDRPASRFRIPRRRVRQAQEKRPS